MQDKQHIILLFFSMLILIAFVGFFQSWNLALTIFNLCIISSIMSLGINIQWGNAGIVNFGVMGFAALGGLANIIVSMPPTAKAWDAGAVFIPFGIIIFIISIILLTIGLLFSFYLSPDDYQQGSTVRIMYIHVPSDWLSLLTYFFMTI